MLGRSITRQSDDTDIHQVDKQLEALHFLLLAGAPQQPLVEVLPYYRLLVHAHGVAQFAFSSPKILVEHFIGGMRRCGAAGRCRVLSAQVRRVSVFGEVCVELDGVLGHDMQLLGEGVELADYALKLGREVAVQVFELLVAVGMVLVQVAEGFKLRSTNISYRLRSQRLPTVEGGSAYMFGRAVNHQVKVVFFFVSCERLA